MNRVEATRRRELWLRVYQHEISRRERIANEKPKAYKKVFASNPKRLNECCEGPHAWVPATVLWIHDDLSRKGSMIDGFKRRGFKEGQQYKYDGNIIIPQICWNCKCTREKIVPDLTWAERQMTLAQHIQRDSKGKPRGKLGRDAMLDNLDDLDFIM